MGLLYDRVQMTTATTGTGTITLGSSVAGYQSFAGAGVPNATSVRYVIQDGNNWEIGTGTYTSSGTTLSRTVISSSNSGSAISLSGNAVVFISLTAEDLASLFSVIPAAVTAASSPVALTSQFNIVTTPTAGYGVQIAAYSSAVGASNYMKIWNIGPNALSVFPPSGAQFDSDGTNVSVNVAAGGAVETYMSTSGQGYAR